ncbi:11139_t:CDS:1 [Ambispora gerdemannii]|uniref:11139_t:CDS:1 n=1 Tax=Ambispora gerdemannii TaxID=144530 RepID=A0A9N8VWE7_9GLOM|nr:11139_t:CDS:1 [Ambispora gerdemannii]
MATFKKLVWIVLIMIICLFALSDAIPAPSSSFQPNGNVGYFGADTGIGPSEDNKKYGRYCRSLCHPLGVSSRGFYCKACWCPNGNVCDDEPPPKLSYIPGLK